MMNFDLQKMDMKKRKNKTKFPKKRKTISMSVTLLSQKSQRSRHLLLVRTFKTKTLRRWKQK